MTNLGGLFQKTRILIVYFRERWSFDYTFNYYWIDYNLLCISGKN